MRRALDLGRTKQLVSDIFRPAEVRNGVTFRETLPRGQERERLIEEVIAEQTSKAATLDDLVARFRRLVGRHEPIQLIKSIAIPAGSGFYQAGPWLDDAADTFTWPAKVEYLLGTALSIPPGTQDVSRKTIERVVALLTDIFEAATAKHLVGALATGRSGNFALDRVLFTLRLEHLTDRMPGYVRHIERIDAEVFDCHRIHYLEDLGFSPADVTRVVRRHVAHGNQRVNALLREAQKARPESEAFALAIIDMVQAMDQTRQWSPEEVTATTGVNEREIAAMLSYFSTTWGSQPDFRLPGDTNVALVRPCIDLGDGSYFIPDPWSISAAVHPRLSQDAVEGTGVLKRYWDHRAKAHQRLVAGALEGIFGALVHQEQHYAGAAGPGEVDALVAVNWPLVVEAKARGLTASGRRGAPKRVETVTKDVVEKALSQTARARAYILDEGGREFADHEAGPLTERLPATVDGVTEVIVTFERMDPVATVGPALVGEEGRPVWITGLADLLMCTDILNDPASFHHYVRKRAEATAAGIGVSMESDALSGYLIDRLSSQLDQAARNPDATLELGYSSGAVNEYFTATEIGIDSKRPSSGVPVQVTRALADTVGEPGWSAVVDTVMGVDAGTWKRFKRYARRHQSGRFDLGDHLRLDLGAKGFTVETATVTLGVQSRRAS